MALEMEGGRFDFDDGGSYVGEWCEGRAHGLGIATGPENQGEYSGEWNMGFESRGVYIWPSGNIYSGTWLKGKRHGEGVQVKGRWLYRGSFTTGFCGRYGVKESLTSCAKYEGSWHLNQFDGFGVETNSDGSTYAGAWSKGMRQGLGVRRSAPYALASEFNRAVRAAQSQNSLPSGTDSERNWKVNRGSGGGSGGDVCSSGERGRPDERRSGFVLRSVSYPPPSQGNMSQSGYRSATPTMEKKSLFKRGIFRKLRKQKSTSDLSMIGRRAVGGFSTTGCGGGGFFQNRLRSGGSLRSNLSASSQLTTNSFGRGDLKDLDNGGHGLHEVMDEVLGPNVTETYSGQWNEDRRSGYGVAERSDGLQYAGEWFNNKKDGYGVTYRQDGTKEEGRYKENILVQVLNRKSKLFMLRHGKLRDAIEEAVKNANDAARKAQENSCESAYQRANTARLVANTADSRAVEARKLSEEARAIAREFSPEFVQLGLIWEKQNPLLKKDIFGTILNATNADDEQINAGFKKEQNNVYSQSVMKENTLNPADATNQIGNHLEVSGGSRQGSFRSSFRRHGNARYDQQKQNEQYSSKQMLDHNPELMYTKDSHGSGQVQHYLDQVSLQNANQYPSRSPAGRPIARAATTGFSGLGYPYPEQNTLAQHMAQHPHSPYIMASTSHNLDADLEPPVPDYNSVARLRGAKFVGSGQLHPPTVVNAELSQSGEHRPTEIKIDDAKLVQPTQAYHASVGYAEAKCETNYAPNQQAQNSSLLQQQQPNDLEYISDKWEEMSTISKDQNSGSHTANSTSSNRVRRRTLPSIMTEPPIQTTIKTGIKDSTTRRARAPINRITELNPHLAIDDPTVQSAENLPAEAAATYIIENGIRKRVQAETKQQQLERISAAQRLGEANDKKGSRPEWTTSYDPYRPAMESSIVVASPNDYREYDDFDKADFLTLPRSYRIESVTNLNSTLKEVSMPDISQVCNNSINNGEHKRRRIVANYVSGQLTREEVSRLSQARRQELYKEMERRKRGEIVIRLADIKDWIRSNFVIVFVLLLNASLAFLFYNLISENNQPASGNVNTPPETVLLNQQQQQQQQISDPNTIAKKAIRTVKKVISTASKSKNSNPHLVHKP